MTHSKKKPYCRWKLTGWHGNMSIKDIWESDSLIVATGKIGLNPIWKKILFCYTVGSKTYQGSGAGVYGYGTRWKLGIRFVKYTRVFQADVYAINACTVKNLDWNYRNRNIYILSGSQVSIKALDNYQMNSKLIWNCHQSVEQLA